MGGGTSKQIIIAPDELMQDEKLGLSIRVPVMKIDKSHFQSYQNINKFHFQFKTEFFECISSGLSNENTNENIDSIEQKNFVSQEIKLHLNEKEYSYEALEAKKHQLWSHLSFDASYRILSFLIDDLGVLTQVSKEWKLKIKNIFEFKLSSVKNNFEIENRRIFHDITSKLTLSSVPGKSNKNSVHLKFRIKAKVGKLLHNKTVRISFEYKLTSRPKYSLYANYVFDVLGKGKKKVLWVNKEERRWVKGGEVLRYIPIIPVSVEDSIELALNVWSPEGLIDIKTIKWLPVGMSELQKGFFFSPGNLGENQRTCDIERKVNWLFVKGDPRECLLPRDFLYPSFERLNFYSNGLEMVNVKADFKAIKQGTLVIRDQHNELKINIGKKESSQLHKLSRVGLMSENGSLLNLKVGDELKFYLSLV